MRDLETLNEIVENLHRKALKDCGHNGTMFDFGFLNAITTIKNALENDNVYQYLLAQFAGKKMKKNIHTFTTLVECLFIDASGEYDKSESLGDFGFKAGINTIRLMLENDYHWEYFVKRFTGKEERDDETE